MKIFSSHLSSPPEETPEAPKPALTKGIMHVCNHKDSFQQKPVKNRAWLVVKTGDSMCGCLCLRTNELGRKPRMPGPCLSSRGTSLTQLGCGLTIPDPRRFSHPGPRAAAHPSIFWIPDSELVERNLSTGGSCGLAAQPGTITRQGKANASSSPGYKL